MSLKVLVLSYDAVPGISAAGQHFAQLIPSLAERAEVDAMSLKFEHMVHIQKLGAARLMRIPTPGTHNLERIAAFGRAVHRQLDGDSYDLVVCSDLFAAQAVASHPSSAKMPLITDIFTIPSLHELPENQDDDAEVSASLAKIIQQGLAASSRIICHSQEMRKYLQRLGMLPKKLILAPLGLDTQIFSPPKIEIPADPTACVVATVVERNTGAPTYPLLLEQWSHLPQRLKLVLLTTEDLRATLMQQINMTGLSQKIQVKADNSPEELAKSLHAADVQLCWQLQTNPNEVPGLRTSTLVAYDALLCNRPVVTTGFGELAELLRDEPAQQDNQQAAIEQAMLRMSKLANSSALRARSARQGRERLLDRINSERYKDLIFSLAEQLCHEKLEEIERDSDFDPSMTDEKPAPPVHNRPIAEPTLETEVTDPGQDRPLPSFTQDLKNHAEQSTATQPALRTLSLADSVDKVGENSTNWDHDTVAMPMTDPNFDEEKESIEALVPGSRSMALLNDVQEMDVSGLETEIMPRDPGLADGYYAAGRNQDLSNKTLPDDIENDLSTDATVRISINPSLADTSPPPAEQNKQAAPLHTPAPIIFDEPDDEQVSLTSSPSEKEISGQNTIPVDDGSGN